MLQEARAASALNHPNIVTIYSIEEAEGFTMDVYNLFNTGYATTIDTSMEAEASAIRLHIRLLAKYDSACDIRFNNK